MILVACQERKELS